MLPPDVNRTTRSSKEDGAYLNVQQGARHTFIYKMGEFRETEILTNLKESYKTGRDVLRRTCLPLECGAALLAAVTTAACAEKGRTGKDGAKGEGWLRSAKTHQVFDVFPADFHGEDKIIVILVSAFQNILEA